MVKSDLKISSSSISRVEALKLFSKKGFEQTTVADIVTAAEIGRGTFYNYFPDVKAIFTAVVDQMNLEIQELSNTARKDATNLNEVLYISFKSYFDYVSDNKLRKNFHEKNHAYIRTTSYGSQSFKQIMGDLKEDLNTKKILGEFNQDHEIQLLSLILIGTPVELFLNLLSSNMKIKNEEMATFLAKLFTKVLK